MVQRDPGDEWVELTAYERRQLALIEQSLDWTEPGQPDTVDFVGYPIWLVMVVTWGWLALMGVAAGSPVLALVPLIGASATLGAHLSRQSPRSAQPDDSGAAQT